jgi:hypothetical protein
VQICQQIVNTNMQHALGEQEVAKRPFQRRNGSQNGHIFLSQIGPKPARVSMIVGYFEIFLDIP